MTIEKTVNDIQWVFYPFLVQEEVETLYGQFVKLWLEYFAL